LKFSGFLNFMDGDFVPAEVRFPRQVGAGAAFSRIGAQLSHPPGQPGQIAGRAIRVALRRAG